MLVPAAGGPIEQRERMNGEQHGFGTVRKCPGLFAAPGRPQEDASAVAAAGGWRWRWWAAASSQQQH